MDFVWHPTTPEQFAQLSRYKKLRHRLDWSFLGPGAYYLREIWFEKMIRPAGPQKWRSAIRRDKAIVASFVVPATIALAFLGWNSYGSALGAGWMVFKVLVVPFLAFCFVIGATVHVHHVAPDIRWYRRREWTKYAGQMDGTTILRIPRVLDFFFHQIFIHIPHHVDMRIPFYRLDMAAKAIKGTFPDVIDKKFSVRDWTANTKACKLYDFEGQRWLTYKQASDYLASLTPQEAAARLALCAERPVVR
jgi:omega-6 fatty acid desaturase (delta-12 desaturase)